MEIQNIILILIAGTAAGFLNTVGGGGSLITVPILIFLGLPSATANGTNRIAIMIQNIIAITNFKSKGFFDWKLSIMLGIPAVLGSILGADIAVKLPDEVFNKILAVVMLLVLSLIIFKPKNKSGDNESGLSLKRKITGMAGFFFVGLYGGLVQAGVGFIIIALLSLISGFSLARINSIKVFVVTFYMLSSFIVFLINGRVDWVLGLTLSAGNGLGAYLGSNFSVKGGDKWIKVVLTATILFMSAKLFGLFDLF